jgi:hypothetical protein
MLGFSSFIPAYGPAPVGCLIRFREDIGIEQVARAGHVKDPRIREASPRSRENPLRAGFPRGEHGQERARVGYGSLGSLHPTRALFGVARMFTIQWSLK